MKLFPRDILAPCTVDSHAHSEGLLTTESLLIACRPEKRSTEVVAYTPAAWNHDILLFEAMLSTGDSPGASEENEEVRQRGGGRTTSAPGASPHPRGVTRLHAGAEALANSRISSTAARGIATLALLLASCAALALTPVRIGNFPDALSLE